jgi:hypothetical protein
MEENGLEPETCEKFILIHSRILHAQHAHMLDVKHSWLHLLGHSEGHLMADLTDKQLQIKEDTARSILQVADKIIPGMTFSVSIFYFFYFLPRIDDQSCIKKSFCNT